MCVNERNSTMAKFKQVAQTFLFRKLVGFWGNMVKNYKDDVQYSSFFEILLNGLDHDEGVALIEAAYPPDELTEKGALRQGNDRRGGRLRRLRVDLDDTLDDVFKALWNHRKSRTRCRKVLLTIRDRLLTSRPPTKNDVLESRLQELKRVLKLSDLEAEILFVAYAVSETGLGWPRRLDDREKPLFFAMALDRAYGEVMKALTPRGRLRTFNLLDEDWDFNGGTLGGYLDGTEDAALERRFYGRNPEGAQGKPGDNGQNAPILVFRGKWDSSKTYYGNSSRVDCVKSGNAYYVTQTNAPNGTNGFSGIDTSNGTYWKLFGASFESIATGLLLAENANIANLIFKNQRLESSAKTKGDPNIFFDGISGNAKFGWIRFIGNELIGYDTNGIERFKLTPEKLPSATGNSSKQIIYPFSCDGQTDARVNIDRERFDAT